MKETHQGLKGRCRARWGHDSAWMPGLMLSRHPIVMLTSFLPPDVCDAAAVYEESKSIIGFFVSLKKDAQYRATYTDSKRRCFPSRFLHVTHRTQKARHIDRWYKYSESSFTFRAWQSFPHFLRRAPLVRRVLHDLPLQFPVSFPPQLPPADVPHLPMSRVESPPGHLHHLHPPGFLPVGKWHLGMQLQTWPHLDWQWAVTTPQIRSQSPSTGYSSRGHTALACW